MIQPTYHLPSQTLAAPAAFLLEADPWTRRILKEERVEVELETARRIRTSLLEPARVGETPLVSWASHSCPGGVVGGDFHDISPRRSGGLDVVLGQVAARGLRATLAAASCANQVLRSAAALGDSARPWEILRRASDAFAVETAPRSIRPGLTFLRMDGDPLTLTVAAGGQGRVAIRSADGSVYEPRLARTASGHADGVIPESTIALLPGDLVFMFTDELIEFARKHLGVFSLATWLGAAGAEMPETVVADLAHEIDQWHPDGGAPESDVTFAAIRVKACWLERIQEKKEC